MTNKNKTLGTTINGGNEMTAQHINKITGRQFKIVKELWIRGQEESVHELLEANRDGLAVCIYEKWNDEVRLVDGKMFFRYENGQLSTKRHHKDWWDMKNTFHLMAEQMYLCLDFRMFILEEVVEETTIENAITEELIEENVMEETTVIDEQQVIEEVTIETNESNDIPNALSEIAESATKLTSRRAVYDAYFANKAIYILCKNNKDTYYIRRSVYEYNSFGFVHKEILNETQMCNKLDALLEYQSDEDLTFFSVMEK